MQHCPFPRLVSSESVFSFQLMGLWLNTWHTTCFAIINLNLPIVALQPLVRTSCRWEHTDVRWWFVNRTDTAAAVCKLRDRSIFECSSVLRSDVGRLRGATFRVCVGGAGPVWVCFDWWWCEVSQWCDFRGICLLTLQDTLTHSDDVRSGEYVCWCCWTYLRALWPTMMMWGISVMWFQGSMFVDIAGYSNPPRWCEEPQWCDFRGVCAGIAEHTWRHSVPQWWCGISHWCDLRGICWHCRVLWSAVMMCGISVMLFQGSVCWHCRMYFRAAWVLVLMWGISLVWFQGSMCWHCRTYFRAAWPTVITWGISLVWFQGSVCWRWKACLIPQSSRTSSVH